jgi:citrate synthase
MGEWINAAEAAQRLGVKQATLYAYVSRGMLSRRRGEDGRSSLFEAAEIARLAERGQPRRAAGSGDFVIESGLTELTDGRIRYRGMEVTKLALWRPFEEVAGWLWTGALGKDGKNSAGKDDATWQATQAAVAAGSGAQAALPEGTLPLERLRVIVPAMAATDPLRLHLDPPAVIAAGRNIIAGMIDCLPDPASSSAASAPGAPSARLAEGGIAGRLWYKICPKRPDPGLLGALRAAMALLADHELAASTFAARMAASVRADPYAVVATGLGALGGVLDADPRRVVTYGGSLGAETMLAAARDAADAVRVVGDQMRRGERIPGFGTFAHSADPRAKALLDLVKKAAPRSSRYSVADAVLAETRRRALPEPNIDFALATLVSVAGMIPGAGEAIFAVARSAGWIAHAMEEYAKNAPLRPRTVYTGPVTVPAPRRPPVPLAPRDLLILTTGMTGGGARLHQLAVPSGRQSPQEGRADGRPPPQPRRPLRARPPAVRRLLPQHPRLRDPDGDPRPRRVPGRSWLGERPRPRPVRDRYRPRPRAPARPRALPPGLGGRHAGRAGRDPR